MRWLTSRGAGDPSETDSVEETPAEPEATEAAAEVDGSDHDEQLTGSARRVRWSGAIVYVVLPALALLLASAAGFLKWQDGSARDAATARTESVQAATDSTIALLSYKPDTVEKDLDAARGPLSRTLLS